MLFKTPHRSFLGPTACFQVPCPFSAPYCSFRLYHPISASIAYFLPLLPNFCLRLSFSIPTYHLFFLVLLRYLFLRLLLPVLTSQICFSALFSTITLSAVFPVHLTSCRDHIKSFIAICAKVWNRVNLSIFASSEAKTCSTSIAMTRCSIFIILVVSESPR